MNKASLYTGTSVASYNNLWANSSYDVASSSYEDPQLPPNAVFKNTFELLGHCYNSLPNCINKCRDFAYGFFSYISPTIPTSPEPALAATAVAQPTFQKTSTMNTATPPSELKIQHNPSTIKSYNVEVEKNWSIYVEESGNPNGIPVVFVHGGPGAHFKPTDHQWFDPEKYRIILFQQRGTYKCQPSAEDLTVSSTVFQDIGIETLAEDIEVLREHLGISKWLVFGGSWGSTLGLYYAQEYPQSCTGLIIRGIFLSSYNEMSDTFTREKIDAKLPNWNTKALEHLQDYASSQDLDSSPENMCNSYRTMILERNDLKAAMLWRLFEKYIELNGDQAMLQRLLDESSTPTGEERSVGLWETQMFNQITKSIDLLHDDRLSKLASLPIKIVHGKQDTLCPAQVAENLTRELRNFGTCVDLSLIEGGQHSPYSHPAMIDALVRATDQFAVSATFDEC